MCDVRGWWNRTVVFRLHFVQPTSILEMLLKSLEQLEKKAKKEKIVLVETLKFTSL